MQTIFATALVLGLLMALMAIGVMLKGKALRGSCGGSTGACGCSPAKQARCAAEGKGPHDHPHEALAGDDDLDEPGTAAAPARARTHLPVLDPRSDS